MFRPWWALYTFLVFGLNIAFGIENVRKAKPTKRFYQCDLHLTNHKPTAYIVFREVFFSCSCSVSRSSMRCSFHWHFLYGSEMCVGRTTEKKCFVKVLVYNILRAQVQTRWRKKKYTFCRFVRLTILFLALLLLLCSLFTHFIVVCNIFHDLKCGKKRLDSKKII